MKYEITRPLALHEIGQREKQEDSIFPKTGEATDQDRLFILCDGMGGHQAGEVASSTVCDTISKFILEETNQDEPFTDELLYEAINRAYDALDMKDNNNSTKKMGTTLVLLYFHAGGVLAAHMGDSRYYHLRPKENEIIYRSRDHSMATAKYEAGKITLEEMSTMPGKNVVYCALQPHQEKRDQPDIVHIKDIKPDDWFYICSDGMLEQMDDEELLHLIGNKELTEDQKINWLITSTENNKDNHSAYLIHVIGVMSEVVDENQPDDEAAARIRNRVFMDERNLKNENKTPKVIEDNTSFNHSDIVVSTQQQVEVEKRTPSSFSQKANFKNYWFWIAIMAILLAVSALAYIFIKSDNKIETPKVEYRYYEDESPSSNKSVNNDDSHNNNEETPKVKKTTNNKVTTSSSKQTKQAQKDKEQKVVQKSSSNGLTLKELNEEDELNGKTSPEEQTKGVISKKIDKVNKGTEEEKNTMGEKMENNKIKN